MRRETYQEARARDIHEAIALEDAAYASFRNYLAENRELLSVIAHHGDGRGGALIAILKESLFPDREPCGASPRGSRK